jgi:acyl-CoA synthetase (AMP-forming)/AMP-acid ligase II
MILFSGEKISPVEVDAVLLSHPDIAQAVAFGVPDDKYGEEVTQFISSIIKHQPSCLVNTSLILDPTRSHINC